MPSTSFCKNLCTGTFASLIIFLSPAATQSQSVSQSGIDQERLARIPAQMKSFVEQGTIAGAVTLIARRGRLLSLEAVGYQDLESKKPMRRDTIFDIRSVTKPVTAIGIMMLLEQGNVGGSTITIAMLDHPKNVGFPTDWHARGYGLFAGNPFGQEVFSSGKERLSFALDSAQSVTFWHRILIFSGASTRDRWKRCTSVSSKGRSRCESRRLAWAKPS